jgi:uncharacterized membrane protein YgcG
VRWPAGMKWTILAPLLVVLGVSGASAQSRTLRWSRLAVTAHLDADGRLQVKERHSIVFDGDWNGGERIFRRSLENEIHLGRLSRVDESGAQIPLRENKTLADVDDYAWTDSYTLRWRSRLPSDPSFQHREITYVLEYTDSNILIPVGGSYQLDHNFGLPDLEWPIDAYSVDLSLDPVWQPLEAVPAHIVRANQPRGENVTVTANLRHAGATRPAAVNFGAPAWLRIALLALLLGGAGFYGREFWQREKAIGRFQPLVDPASIDRRWLDEHVFNLPAEVVGAAWDDRTGTAEVAALIARLAQEGKLSSRINKDGELVLTMRCPKNSLEGYEAWLVHSLFFDGDTTSTSKIKAHYKSQGFDPVSKIRAPLQQRIGTMAGTKDAPEISRAWTVILVVAGIVLLGLGGVVSVSSGVGAIPAGLLVLILYLAGLAGAIDYRRRLSNLARRSVQFVPAILLILAVPANMLVRGADFRFHALILGGLVLVSLAFVRSLLNLAKSRDAGDCLEHRRWFTAAREYFAQELRRPKPALDDAWFPYVLAFGLAPDADRWFHSFGGERDRDSSSGPPFDSSSGSPSTSSSGPSGGSSWTGFGGGASGGAGASGAWAVAATTMAAGVPSPSSEGSSGGSSGGGGGGGGGSSGGGGGGGW